MRELKHELQYELQHQLQYCGRAASRPLSLFPEKH
jgi:hypothetical protein